MKKLKRRKKINVFLKWRLHRKGMKDSKNEVYTPSNINGKYYTPYIGRILSEFQAFEEYAFSIIRDRLKELNISIKNLKQQRNDIINSAKAEIEVKNQTIIEVNADKKKDDKTHFTQTIRAIKNSITEIERKAREAINNINLQGNAAESEAKELIKNYNADFNEGLILCREKLTIYWDSLFAECKKRNCGIDINGQFPIEDELITMCNIKNPSADLEVEPYDVISFENLEKDNV